MKKSYLPFLFACLLTLGVTSPPLAKAWAADAPPSKDEPKSDKKKDGTTNSVSHMGDPIFVHLSPMVLPIIDENGAEQLVTIIFDVQVENDDAADDMHTNMPRVMDAIMRALYGGLGQGTLRKGKIVDVAKVKAKTIAAVGEVIGEKNVHDVLIQGVSQRMF